jgi:beta-glucosidase
MAENKRPLYLRDDESLEKRLDDLLNRITLEEKISQMMHNAEGIERLGIPAYSWWNECLHGVARAGMATVFPQAIGLAATWNDTLVKKIAGATGNEARAKHHAAVKQGNRSQYFGLTFWSPNINIFRDPRWGRGHETYGEDPFLTGTIGTAFVRGLQGNHPAYLKAAACAKHYAVHSGPEPERHTFNAKVSPRDLWETYLPAFESLVLTGRVEAIMGAYNRTNDEVCCGSPTLLGKILRGKWKFKGHVVSDCGAVGDFHLHHRVTASAEESAALAVKNGCDLNCGSTYPFLKEAVGKGLITEKEIDVSLRRILRTRFKLGMFDPPEKVPYTSIPESIVNCRRHQKLALAAAQESIVLLKNEGSLLPLRKDLKSIFVTGPSAMNQEVMLGNYNGYSKNMTTVLEGILSRVSPGTQVNYAAGCGYKEGPGNFSGVRYYADQADVIIAVMGLSPRLEGEEGEAEAEAGGDRINIGLPAIQEEYIKSLYETGKPVVLILLNGSALAVNWGQEHIPAILTAWYPGEAGGYAVADVIFGNYNPGGRLPVTFYKSVNDIPAFTDYSMKGRTYRYFEKEPLYPFGFGLSYTKFAYYNLRLSSKKIKPGESLRVMVEVENTGKTAGDEVLQLYISYPDTPFPAPIRSLKGFIRIHLLPGQKKEVTFRLPRKGYSVVNEKGKRVVVSGVYSVSVGGSQPDSRSRDLNASPVLTEKFHIL